MTHNEWHENGQDDMRSSTVNGTHRLHVCSVLALSTTPCTVETHSLARTISSLTSASSSLRSPRHPSLVNAIFPQRDTLFRHPFVSSYFSLPRLSFLCSFPLVPFSAESPNSCPRPATLSRYCFLRRPRLVQSCFERLISPLLPTVITPSCSARSFLPLRIVVSSVLWRAV